MSEIYSDNFPLDESVCMGCSFRFSKVITPIDPESFGLTNEDIEDLGIPDDEDINIEQHTCLISGSDMDYVVKYCSHFKAINNENSFFVRNPYE